MLTIFSLEILLNQLDESMLTNKKQLLRLKTYQTEVGEDNLYNTEICMEKVSE
jgi:hypothetical protein